MTGLAMIERALAPANDGVRAGLQVQIRLRSGRLEQEMFEQLLGTRVRRQETRNSGLYECAFYFDA